MQVKTQAPDFSQQVNQQTTRPAAAITVTNQALTVTAVHQALLKISGYLDTPEILEAFDSAALNGYSFPEQFTTKLSSLQYAYQLNLGNDAIRKLLESY